MIPLDLWNSDEMALRRKNAVAKALKEKPSIHDIDVPASADLMPYRRLVVGEKGYIVCLYADADEQHFIECDCAAGSPPVDPETRLPSREALPCYHAAAVLLLIAEKEKEDGENTDRASE